MRITSGMYYNRYSQSNAQLSENLFNVNKQIASTLSIQYAHDDVRTFTETMRLDNEIAVLGQIKKSTDSALKMSDQTDTVLGEFETSMNRTRTLLLNAANATNSEESLDAIANELRSIEEHLKNLANTSINGQYLFSGSAIDVRPITDDGTYMGNDGVLKAFTGSKTSQQYNISGAELFLGEKKLVQREVSTNVVQTNLTSKYPDFTDLTINGTDEIITTSSTIRDLMGDNDNDLTNSNQSHFYINATQSDGTAVKEHITLSQNNTVGDLLTQIGSAFGNTPGLNVVNVSLNSYGEIVVEDKIKGSSKIDFHMVGATDYNATDGNDAADIDDAIYGANAGRIDNLNDGETDFDAIINGTSVAANSDLYVKSFVKSPYTPVTTPSSKLVSAEFAMDRAVVAGDTLSITVDNGDATTTTYTQAFNADAATTYNDLKTQIEAAGDFSVVINGDTITLNSTAQGVVNGVSIDTDLANDNGSATGAVTVTTTTLNSTAASDIDALLYDRTKFSKDGAKLSSTSPQIIRETNAFATASTKLFDVADLSQGTLNTLDGTSFVVEGTDINGTAYSARIDLASAGSTFSLDTDLDGVYDNGTYNIYNVETPRAAVDGDDMTYKQFMDVVNMLTTGNLPATAPGTATEYDGAIETSDLMGRTFLSHDGKIEFEEINTGTTKASLAIYDVNSGNFSADASVMTFNTNNALTVRDPKTDFFKTFDEIIKSVENYKLYPDSSSGDVRNVGIENAIAMMDDLQDHVYRAHSQVGVQTNSLNASTQRAGLLEISAMSLRSSVVDTDYAEASLTLARLNTNYEAMLSTAAKVSKLSLVNYL
ncbi:MAG: flagellar biosynthesis protein FlgL [Sulfurimonas sp.]|uniref:flagellin N-terminal helical domain-containing protein n=1 Tax=Sulfurimonas sp. TaxID=2022749 RepID=UPI003D143BDA